MVINPNNDISSNSSTHARHKAGNTNASADKATVAPTESTSNLSSDNGVRLSPEAQSIERLETKIQISDGVDVAKVAQLKQQIADGSYEINSQSIAEKILSQEKLLG